MCTLRITTLHIYYNTGVAYTFASTAMLHNYTVTYLLNCAMAGLVRYSMQLHCSKMPCSITHYLPLFANCSNICIMLVAVLS